MRECDWCFGKGRVEQSSERLGFASRRITAWATCPECGGSGVVKIDKKPRRSASLVKRILSGIRS